MREKTRIILLFLAITFLFTSYSCILDEFKFKDVHLEDDWKLEIITPLFYGDFIFTDLINKANQTGSPIEQPTTVLVSSNDTITIYANAIYEPALIINGFNFLIEGANYLKSGTLQYTVTNGSPFPLQLQMYFYEKEKPGVKGPAFIPSHFAGGIVDNNKVIPVKTIHSLDLTPDQLESFKKANRIDFITRFDTSESAIQTDTLRGDYPVNFSVVFSGTVHRKYE